MSLQRPLIVSLALTAMLVSACGSDTESTGASPAESGEPAKTITTVSVGSPGSASDAGLYIADARGYFKAVGIDMEYQKVKGGGDLIPLLSTGKLDVGGLSINSGLLNAIASGNELEVVADKGSYTDGSTPSYGALLVRPDLADKIKGPGDLKGRNIAVGSAGSALDVAIDTYLGQGGLSTKDVKLTVLGQNERVLALEKGAVDVAFVFEPFLSKAQKSGAGKLLVDGGAMVPNQQNAVVVYAGEFSSKKPDVAQAFMSAYICGLQDYNTAVVEGKDPDPVIKIVADVTGADAEVLGASAPIGLKPDGSVNVEDIERTIQALAKSGLVTKPVPAKDVVNTKFLEGATPCDKIRDMAGTGKS